MKRKTSSTEATGAAKRPLEGWKEISSYLQRSVRTAKRWEQKEGLPVRRQAHESRTSVYAFPSELDRWRVDREPGQRRRMPQWRRWRGPVPAVAATIALAVALLTAGNGPPTGTMTAQAAEDPGITTRQVWVDADGAGTPSPDGKYFTTIDWKTCNLALRDMETEEVRLLTNEGTWDEPMQMTGGSIWSADGKRVVYFWEGPDELRVLDIDNPRPSLVYRDPEGRSITPIQFTPDESAILVSTYRPGQPGEIALISVDDAAMRVLTTVDDGTFHASLSPDGRYLVYDRSPENDFPASDLFVKPLDGGEETSLVVHPADDSLLGWTPDDEWVLFVSDRTGSSCIYAIRVRDGAPAGEPVLMKRGVGKIFPAGFTRDGSFYYALVKAARDVYTMEVHPETGKVLSPPEKTILQYEGSNMDPHYSPDGDYLAYISKRGNSPYPTNRGNTLCVRSLVTGEERVFYKEFGRLRLRYVVGPAWSPDSGKIMLAAPAGDSFGFYVADPNTGEVAEVMKFAEGVLPRAHLWAPDGESFYYSRREPGRGIRVLRRELESGNEREIRTTSDKTASSISLSPDGRWLAFSNASEDKTLQVMPAGGGEPRLLYRFKPHGYGVPHTWTPDGRFILFTTGANRRTLCRIPAEGGELQQLWPDVLSLGPITVHPDGRHIAFAAATEIDSAADIWVMENLLPARRAMAEQQGR